MNDKGSIGRAMQEAMRMYWQLHLVHAVVCIRLSEAWVEVYLYPMTLSVFKDEDLAMCLGSLPAGFPWLEYEQWDERRNLVGRTRYLSIKIFDVDRQEALVA